MTNPTRQLAATLRHDARGTEMYGPGPCSAATPIDALLDAIEAGGMVQVRQAPQMDLGPLRELRAWHRAQHDSIRADALGSFKSSHAQAVRQLNVYFPPNDQL